MRSQWTGALAGAAAMLVVALAVAAGFYFHSRPSRSVAPGEAANSVPPVQAMTLEAQFKGPLKDTVIQRWKDPETGTTCYIYLPVVVQHSPPTPTGYVQYGANGIGSVSCLSGP